MNRQFEMARVFFRATGWRGLALMALAAVALGVLAFVSVFVIGFLLIVALTAGVSLWLRAKLTGSKQPLFDWLSGRRQVIYQRAPEDPAVSRANPRLEVRDIEVDEVLPAPPRPSAGDRPPL